MRERSKHESAEGAEVVVPLRSSVSTANELTDRIIGSAIEVHRHLGPSLLESAYEECLCYELSQIGPQFERQVPPLPISYKGVTLDCSYKLDVLVENRVIVEIKAIDQLLPIHTAQLLTYLKLSGKQVGLLINFHEPVLKKCLRRLVNRSVGSAPRSRVSAPSALEPNHVPNATPSRDSYLSSSPRLRVSAVKNESPTARRPA